MITIIGGTYNERCFEPIWEETYGSGLRACKAILTIDKNREIEYFTFLEKGLEPYLESYSLTYPNLKCYPTLINESLSFHYDYPLNDPRIYPRLDTIKKEYNVIDVSANDIIMYGMLEGSAKVIGRRVVYDPQSPVDPIPFHTTGSVAGELAVVINLGEATAMVGSGDIEEIKKYFFDIENAKVLVLKMGAKGALVSINDDYDAVVSVYKTDNVWSIGSGDIFTSIFSYWWFQNLDPVNSARRASYATAEYCNWKDFQFSEFESNKDIIPLKITTAPKGLIYLAGPFFTFAQRWLIDQIRKALSDMGLNVFSPLHDVGYGYSLDIAEKDLKALDSCSIVFSVLDGLDSGTLFEVGYAIAKNIPVLGYVQNETSDSLLMLEGTSCLFETDLTTAIYKAYWLLSRNE
jgi:nucleoside 2-deoxyribosyltransferase